MSASIRLRPQGRKKRITYEIIVTARRNSVKSQKHIDIIGFYDPRINGGLSKKARINLEDYNTYVGHGAKPSEIVEKIAKSIRQDTPTNKTIVLLKPNIIEKRDNIITDINKLAPELKLIHEKKIQMGKEKAKKFYKEHIDKPFFQEISQYMTSGPIIALCFEGEDSVMKMRKILGETDPAKSPEGTLRHTYGVNIGINSIHASSCNSDADREYNIIFTS